MPTATAAHGAAVTPASLADVERLVREADARQTQRFLAQLEALKERTEADRRIDLARMSAGLSYLEGRTGQHLARTNELHERDAPYFIREVRRPMIRRRVLLLLTVALGALRRSGRPGGQEPRADLEAMEAILDQAVAKVSRPSVHVVLGGREAARGYRLKGVGAVFVLPPRSLPGPERDRVFVFQGGSERPRVVVRRLAEEHERELAAIEVQVESLQREADLAQRDAERAFEQLQRNVRIRSVQRVVGPGAAVPEPPSAPRPPVPPEAGAAAPEPPPAPALAFLVPPDQRDERPPDRVVADVKAAVVAALETHGGRMGSLGGDEAVVVAIDFLPPRGFDLEPSAASDQSVVIKVKKRDLVEVRSGKISGEEFRRRIDYSEY